VPLGFPTQDAPNGGLWHAKSGSADPSNHNDADLQGTGGTRGASREVGLRSSRPTQSAAKRSATSARIWSRPYYHWRRFCFFNAV